VFRDLLARCSNDTGEDFMTDIYVNNDPARVGRTETISQIHKFESKTFTKVKSNAFNAMDVQFSAGIRCRGVPPKERFIGNPQEYFDEGLRLNSPYRTVFERVASEGMAHFGNQRIEAEKFARWIETDYSLFFIAVEVRKLNDP
jgi:hypothetical protein